MSWPLLVVLSFSELNCQLDGFQLFVSKEHSGKLRNFKHNPFKRKPKTMESIYSNYHNVDTTAKLMTFHWLLLINPTWKTQKQKLLPFLVFFSKFYVRLQIWIKPKHRFASLWIVRSILASQAYQTTAAAWRNRGKWYPTLSAKDQGHLYCKVQICHATRSQLPNCHSYCKIQL